MSEAPAPTKPVPVFTVDDEVHVDNHAPVGIIKEVKLFQTEGEYRYLVNRPTGTGRMSHWLPARRLTLIKGAPAAHGDTSGFNIGDTIRETSLEKNRVLRHIVNGALIVYKDEAAGVKSPLWRWLPENCQVVEAAAIEDPEIILERASFELAQAAAATCDYCEAAPRMAGSNYCADCVSDVVEFFTPPPPDGFVVEPLPGADPAESIIERSRRLTPDEYAAMFGNKTREEECSKCGRLLPIKDIGDHEGNGIVYGACWFCGDSTVDLITEANQRILAAEVRANNAEEHADAETKRAAKLERELIRLQDAIAAGQPITMTNVAPLKECWQVKIVTLLAGDDLSDIRYAGLLNDGWVDDHSSSVISANDAIWNTITFKRLAPVEPDPQPERTTSAGASAAAILTGDEVRRERMNQNFEQQVIEHPVTLNSAPATASEVLSNYREIFSKFSAEEVSANLDRIAHENALRNHNARVANQRDYSPRPLLLTVVVPS